MNKELTSKLITLLAKHGMECNDKNVWRSFAFLLTAKAAEGNKSAIEAANSVLKI